ncbi:MAG: hypothetical protein U0640_02900 [Phycisphaerales bacterium]
MTSYDYTRGTNAPVFGTATGSGTIENYKLLDQAGGNTAGGDCWLLNSTAALATSPSS